MWYRRLMGHYEMHLQAMRERKRQEEEEAGGSREVARRKEIEQKSVQMQRVFRGRRAEVAARVRGRDAAACMMQRHVRGSRERARFDAYRKEKRERLASTRIQARFRGSQARAHAFEPASSP